MRSDVASLTGVYLASVMLLVVSFCTTAETSDSPDGMWIDLAGTDLNALPAKDIAPEKVVRPAEYRAVWLDEEYLDEVLRFAPMEDVGDLDRFAKSAVTLWLPMPDGSNVEFAILESPIMEPGLAEKYPEIRTYAGRSLDGRDLFVRFDRTPKGFHAIVLGGKAVYIDPYKQEGVYVSYFATDYPGDDDTPGCSFEDAHSVDEAKGGVSLGMHGDTLRTYRIAIACTGEYANFHGAVSPETKVNAVAAIATTFNRVNGIFESELAVRLTLIAANDSIVFIDPATDPFTSDAALDVLWTESHTVISTTIQSANYDVGHTLTAAKIGGKGDLGCVCNEGRKALGVTGTPTPTGDPFDVDYVAHELGHQFHARHTFNSKKGNCKDQREPTLAYERGAGTTIMSYAGGCPKGGGGDNIEIHSDAYFHSESLREIQNFIASTTCNGSTATNNNGPVMNAGNDYTIPKQTPFKLSAAANDLEGDTVTYSWEERDLGPAQAVIDPDNGKSPLFRTFPPKLDQFRLFPELSLILGGVQNGDPYELLPSKSRTMTFWVVGRDGHGGLGSDETKIRVNKNAGPFKVTYPNTAVSLTGGKKKKIKWNVANTSASPINTPTVRILLSIDGGLTFPITLKDGTPNDGEEKVKLPNVGTQAARVKVEAIGNIFFDISDRNFTIQGGFSLIGTWDEIDYVEPFTGEISRYTFTADTVTRCYYPAYTSCPATNAPYTFEDYDDPEVTKKLSIPSLPFPDNVRFCKIIDNNTIETFDRVGFPNTVNVYVSTLERQP
ncbi:MAG: hypothetical protein IT366_15525 [Candidatus Hydrogenedentes bacterium]|nr:hypothetical protein [Candidatus Hydrogenedentota bacterium]